MHESLESLKTGENPKTKRKKKKKTESSTDERRTKSHSQRIIEVKCKQEFKLIALQYQIYE